MINQNELNLINKTIMLGTLAQMNSYSTFDAVQPYNNDGENIVFYIEPLSTQSYRIEDFYEDGIINNTYYRGLDNFNTNIYPFNNKLDYKILDQNDKINKIYNTLEDKVILFYPRINAKGQMNLAIEEVLEDAICTSYETIPRVNLSNEEFEYRLKNNLYFELNNYSYLMPNPNYILCGEYIYTGFGEWAIDEDNSMSWRVTDDNFNIKKLRFPLEMEDYKEDIIIKNKDVAFLTFDYLDRIDEAFKNNSTVEVKYTTIIYDNNFKTNENSIRANTNRLDINLNHEYSFLQNLKQYSIKHN